MDNLIDLVRALISVNVVEDGVRSLGENRERVTRALFGVVPAVIARWAIDLQSALEEERLADRLQMVRGMATNLQSQDWVSQVAHELLESDYPEETAQRIFGDAPIDDLFLEATAQYLRVPARLIKVLAPLVDGICLFTIALKLAPDASNRKEIFDYIKGQQQFIPVNMMIMLAGQDVLTAPANATPGRVTYVSHSASGAALEGPGSQPGSMPESQPGSISSADAAEQLAKSQEELSDSTGQVIQPLGTVDQDVVGNESGTSGYEAETSSNVASSKPFRAQPFSGGEIRWVVDDEPAGIVPKLVASWKQQPAAGRAKVIAGIAIALVVATSVWSGLFGGGTKEDLAAPENQLQVVGDFAEQAGGPNAGHASAPKAAQRAALNLDPEIGEDEDSRAMLAAVKQAHAELEANPGKKVMSQPLVKIESKLGVKGEPRDSDIKNIKPKDDGSNESLNYEGSKDKSANQAAVKYNDAISSQGLTQIADRLNSKDAAAGVRNGSSFLLNGITFERSTSKLERAALQPLKALAKILIDNPDLNLKIVGHSDNSGRPDKNQKLSLVRAWSVESELRNQGVVGARIRSEGKGAAEPLTSNTTEEGREQNRRIEFVLYRVRE